MEATASNIRRDGNKLASQVLPLLNDTTILKAAELQADPTAKTGMQDHWKSNGHIPTTGTSGLSGGWLPSLETKRFPWKRAEQSSPPLCGPKPKPKCPPNWQWAPITPAG